MDTLELPCLSEVASAQQTKINGDKKRKPQVPGIFYCANTKLRKIGNLAKGLT